MRIACPECALAFDLPPAFLGKGRKLKCATCQHGWFQTADGKQIPFKAEAPKPIATAHSIRTVTNQDGKYEASAMEAHSLRNQAGAGAVGGATQSWSEGEAKAKAKADPATKDSAGHSMLGGTPTAAPGAAAVSQLGGKSEAPGHTAQSLTTEPTRPPADAVAQAQSIRQEGPIAAPSGTAVSQRTGKPVAPAHAAVSVQGQSTRTDGATARSV